MRLQIVKSDGRLGDKLWEMNIPRQNNNSAEFIVFRRLPITLNSKPLSVICYWLGLYFETITYVYIYAEIGE